MRVAGKLNLIFCLLLASAPLLADTSLPTSAKVLVWSEDHGYFVESVPNGETTVYRMSDGKALWKIPGWHRSVFVSDAGFVAVEDEGVSLLPLNYKSDVVLIAVWHDGQLIHQIRLRELVQNTKLLRRAATRYYWGIISGFDSRNMLEVVTVEGRVLINPETWEHSK